MVDHTNHAARENNFDSLAGCPCVLGSSNGKHGPHGPPWPPRAGMATPAQGCAWPPNGGLARPGDSLSNVSIGEGGSERRRERNRQGGSHYTTWHSIGKTPHTKAGPADLFFSAQHVSSCANCVGT